MLGEDDYSTWITPLDSLDDSDHGITLSATNPIVVDWVRDHYLDDLMAVARSNFGTDFSLTLVKANEPRTQEEGPSYQVADVATHPFNPSFTFDRFVVGPSNQFATAAAEAVADRPGRAYNPLFIYGGSGLGKTHLLHAIANHVVARQPKLNSVYMTTEQFTNEFIKCIGNKQSKQMESFRQTFRKVDILLLDDIQFIGGKERSQEEFFHTFNSLHSIGRQVVVTSDKRPADLQGLEDRLRSRFMQGLIADIQPPDLETRCAILREKARATGHELSEDVVLFIARRVQKNVRELEGCLNRTLAYSHLKSSKVTVDVVRLALFELLPDERETTPADIIRFVAHHYGVRVADLKGRSSRPSLVTSRQVAMFLIRDILDVSFPEIGKIFNKHHSTAIYAVENVQKKRQSNPDFDATLTAFTEHFINRS